MVAQGISAKAQGGKFIDGVKAFAKGAAIGAAVGYVARSISGLGSSKIGSKPYQREGPNQPIGRVIRNEVLSTVGDLVGKVWALPNTIVGLVYGGAGYLVGKAGYLLGLTANPTISFRNNAIQFHNNPFTRGGEAITVGNTISYGSGVNPKNNYAYGDPSVNIGLHEKAHTYQQQVLGPLFLLEYLRSGGFTGPGGNPYEQAAQNYGSGRGGWWPK